MLGDVIGTGIVDISCRSYLADLDACAAEAAGGAVLPGEDVYYPQVEVIQTYPRTMSQSTTRMAK